MNRLETKSDKSGAEITYRALKLYKHTGTHTTTQKVDEEKKNTVPADKVWAERTSRYRFLIFKSNEMETSKILNRKRVDVSSHMHTMWFILNYNLNVFSPCVTLFFSSSFVPKMPIAKTNDHKEDVRQKKKTSARSQAKWHAYAIITVIVCNKEQIAEKEEVEKLKRKKSNTHITMAIVLNEGILATHRQREKEHWA